MLQNEGPTRRIYQELWKTKCLLFAYLILRMFVVLSPDLQFRSITEY